MAINRKYFFLLITFIGSTPAMAQKKMAADSIHQSKIYVVSGMGWAFPVKSTGDVLSSKFSSSLGLDIALKDRHYFLYPSIDFLSFDYNQRVKDPEYPYRLEGGNSNFYILNLATGVRKQWWNLNTYAYVGPGVGYITEPRSVVQTGENLVTIENSGKLTANFRAGMGADYKLGSFFLFLEVGWLGNLTKIQDRPVNLVSMYGGLKTDVTGITNSVVKALGVR